MSKVTIHLLPNAHLDPVWLWDLREGLNEGISLIRSILNLMDEFPKLTFIRGEALIYQHIERYDPASFEKIRQHVTSGRWDIVGGVWVQPDNNLPQTSSFHRHLKKGMEYFQNKFGKAITTGWAPDAFGHAAGLPDVYAAHGLKYFACMRPQPHEKTIDSELFWWEGFGGSRLLTYRSFSGAYCCERSDLPQRLNAVLDRAKTSPVRNLGCFVGLGNHGGGPTRQHILDIESWASEHKDVEVIFSTLHQFFKAADDELKTLKPDIIPVVKGELQYCLRGCYASSARIKYTFRRLEAELERAEKLQAVAGMADARSQQLLDAAEETLLINTFHDILPGSSIERAVEEQVDQMRGALHQCRMAELDTANRIAAKLALKVNRVEGDLPTSVPFVVVNPHPWPYDGYVELEQQVDARPIAKYWSGQNPWEMPLEVLDGHGNPLPFQRVVTETRCSFAPPWRVRTVVKTCMDAQAAAGMTLGYVPEARKLDVVTKVSSPEDGVIVNEHAKVSARPGDEQVRIEMHDQVLFEGLRIQLFEDLYSSWGDWNEPVTKTYWGDPVEKWSIERIQVLEKGPLRAKLWVRFAGKSSRLDLTFSLYHNRSAVDVSARAFIAERGKRLKLVMAGGVNAAVFDVPGGQVRRDGPGEMPGGRWVRTEGERPFTFVSDALYSFNLEQNSLRATIVRTCGFADDQKLVPAAKPWESVQDQGEHVFNFILSTGDAPVERLALELEQPCLVQAVPPAGLR